MLLLYVDDMVITGDDLHGITKLKSFLSQQFEMKDLGYLSYFLGLEVSSDSKGYYLTQARPLPLLLKQMLSLLLLMVTCSETLLYIDNF